MAAAHHKRASNISREGTRDSDVAHSNRCRRWQHSSSDIVAELQPVSCAKATRVRQPRAQPRTLRQSIVSGALRQSRSNSLMLVFARVRSSTRLTITAQAVAGLNPAH